MHISYGYHSLLGKLDFDDTLEIVQNLESLMKLFSSRYKIVLLFSL
jgi:hypothetical protein